jgi:hypothetical protein
MEFSYWKSVVPALVVLAAVVVIGGCGEQQPDGTKPGAVAPEGTTQVKVDHGGWWCTEHGVPEEECALCSAKVADDFKAKGDWCKEHNRPESQCFLCDPSRAETFAARYEAKFGAQPPKPTE